MAAAVLASWTAAAVEVGAGLEIEAGTPDDPCPDVASARAAIQGRLGGVLVDEGDGRWRVNYSTYYAPEHRDRRVLRVEILDPAGRLDRRRDLPATGATCEAMAQAIALVVENRFRQPDAAVVARPAEVATSAPPLAPAAPSERATAWVAGAGASESGLRLGVELGVAARLSRRWGLGLGAMVPARTQREDLGPIAADATASLTAVPVRLSLGFAALETERVRLELGPELYASVERARTEGLSSARAATRVVAGGGAGAQVTVRLGAGFGLLAAASVVGTLPLAGSQLTVEHQGQPLEVLRQPWVVTRVAVGFTHSFFW